jgi:hypothetical protein
MAVFSKSPADYNILRYLALRSLLLQNYFLSFDTCKNLTFCLDLDLHAFCHRCSRLVLVHVSQLMSADYGQLLSPVNVLSERDRIYLIKYTKGLIIWTLLSRRLVVATTT